MCYARVAFVHLFIYLLLFFINEKCMKSVIYLHFTHEIFFLFEKYFIFSLHRNSFWNKNLILLNKYLFTNLKNLCLIRYFLY